ncbi:hypothetical protein ONS95_004426 [Cadophora gregata]|uniref:uncharacterized protein n=1 Tax=Cadophora gregata TaxID=51156 RepID=UPI0026DB6D61|nr:uncharacterized protein ONS95_004426 [Cadophora gregata]KAK0105176.1 hypothetical protein ONS96_004577 [Cadophora gregata f. sp. sojae]KAK0105913.1 hypothetical protein ONS95_004426 [Cadophora gregata]
MPKSKKGAVAEEACPSIDHHQDHTSLLNNKSNSSKRSRAARKSDKSHKSNGSGRDTSHGTSATLKPADAKKSKTISVSRKSRISNKTDEECYDTDHEESSNSKQTRLKNQKRATNSGSGGLETSHDSETLKRTVAKTSRITTRSRRSQESNKTEEGQPENVLKQLSNSTSKEAKKPKSSSRSRKSRDSNKTEEVCPNPEHEPSRSLEYSKTKASSKSKHQPDPQRTKESYPDVGHLSLENPKSKPSPKSRTSRDSSEAQEMCPDMDHEASSSTEDPKTSRSSPKSRRTRHSNDREEQCLDSDHETSTSAERPSKVKFHAQNQNLSKHADCDQLRDVLKSSTSDRNQMPRKAGHNETASSPADVKKSSEGLKKPRVKSKSKLMDKLKRSKPNEDCQDGDHEASPKNHRKEKKPKEPKKEKKVKSNKKSHKADINQDNCVDTDHWLSSSDAKKLRKLIKSREERAKKPLENAETSAVKIDKPKGSKFSKQAAKKDCTCVQEHDLANCDAVQTNDGAASRKASSSYLNTTLQRTPAQAFPRGIQIMAKNTNTLEGGFPYLKELGPFGITKEDWAKFCSKLTEPLTNQKIPYAIEKVLDLCAEEDVKVFRPKGFIMRLDMPGEEQYGLDIMDIYHSQLGGVHTDNFTTMPPNSKEHSGAIKHKHHVRERTKDRKHLETLREKAFKSTRLILDPIIVLKDPHLATQRGWARWIIACNQAQKLAAEAPPKRTDNKPWYGYFPARWDRWPPSKHLYYDRFRGTSHTLGSKSSPSTCFIPDYDSMDQRGSPYTSSVVPCDEVEFAVLHSDQQ